MKKQSTMSLLGRFIKKNPISSFWTLLLMFDYFAYGLRPVLSLQTTMIKMVWLMCFVVITVVIGFLLKKYLFSYNEKTKDYGMERLTDWVDDSPVIYFVLCLIVSGGFEWVFQIIIKDIFLSI
jgi:hypothetical protein